VAYILCLETATNTCSVALSKEKAVVAEEHISEGMRHSQALTSLIDAVLATAGIQPSDLGAVAISDGPGSYTGLRVGASTAKAICYAHSIPLIAVSTLEGIADSYGSTETPIMATLDARRMEVYAAIYRDNEAIEEVQSVIWDASYLSSLMASYPSLQIVGTGVEKAQDLFTVHTGIRYEEIECRASFLAGPAYQKLMASDFVDIDYHSPNYFKMPNITTPKRKF